MRSHPSSGAVRTGFALVMAMLSSGCVTLRMWDALPEPAAKKSASKTASPVTPAAGAKPAESPKPAWNVWDVAWRVALTPMTLAVDVFMPEVGWRQAGG